jgi:hypothetical protein
MVDGLWAGYQNASIGDYPTVMKRMKLLGFNGIRLPFTFTDLDKAPNQAIYVTNCKVRGQPGQTTKACIQYIEVHRAGHFHIYDLMRCGISEQVR